ncbi:UV-endonuclease UvdE [Aulographum hederae CBS 113979]|uniref:UV-endonuclease UvdE n=1 Tax=Aulographum hederae CBS 113979 TaxID=1176131 RepID=A0A6G1HDS7_9PEZI|nr:UV-endonuclease UvdE [Aulographum hederae CBS 113979]
MAPKRKRSTQATSSSIGPIHVPIPPPLKAIKSATSRKGPKGPAVNPDANPDIIDGLQAARASPDSHDSDSPLSDVPEVEPAEKKAVPAKKATKASTNNDTKKKLTAGGETAAESKPNTSAWVDPEAEGDEEADEEEIKEALSRPPPVNSDYLPLPWKGRLGYACLNTYLRFSNPPVFSSRTCRIASILEHRHPLKDPSQPEHATKNRPDKEQPADIRRGMEYVENIGLANARDIIKMLRWNDRYGIKFMRLSSEMFPFASHEEYGYKLASFAAETLAEVGKVIAELGHRVTTHPGQFTQLGSPRPSVISNAIRDLNYHDEMLSLLKLPEQQNRDAVMILHMGGVFGDKAATLDRFRSNYAALSPSVKNRLVLENDDVSWSVHDLLPVCQELNIPMVLDYHHHNIIFDASQGREGTKDIMALYDAIRATWTRKNITQKMHYSEPTPKAITRTQRRKHNPRVATLPPCRNDMDLMIEAKDKEQAVFELMRTFKLPGFDTFNDLIPHVRDDDNKPVRAPKKKATPKKRTKRVKAEAADDDDVLESAAEDAVAEKTPELVPEDEVGMGGPEGRVYWPPGMEEWLRPKKREVKKKDVAEEGVKPKLTAAQRKKVASEVAEAVDGEVKPVVKGNGRVKAKSAAKPKSTPTPVKKKAQKGRKGAVPTPSSSDGEDAVSEAPPDLSEEEKVDEAPPAKKARDARSAPVRQSRREAKVSYAEGEDTEME